MPKINVYLPDDLAEAVKENGVPVSAVCQRALEQAVRRLSALREVVSGDLDAGELAELLPQFTGRAGLVLRLAADQARADGCAELGSSQLLRGILAEGDNLALEVLRALEIDLDQVSHDLANRPATDPAARSTASADGALRLSPAAAVALELTITEMTALGHNYVGTEHLLLGLIAEPDGTAGRVLRGAGAELRLTRRAIMTALAGYSYLKTRLSSAAAAPAALRDHLHEHLQPLIQRIERLEERAQASK